MRWLCEGCFDNKIKSINYCLGYLSLFLFSCLVWIAVETFFDNNWHIHLSIDGIKGLQSFWGEFSPLIIIFGSTLTLWIASRQLAKYLDVETINALVELRKLLNTDEKKRIHYYLLDDEDKDFKLKDIDKSVDNEGNLKIELSNVELFDYIGTIELGAIMLQRGIISRKEFYSQFGYRAENLWKNADIRKHITNYPRYYKDFNYIVNTFNL